MGLKHRVGHLFQRDKSFYVRWRVDGKVFSKALRDESGNVITKRREAEEARRKMMAPLAVANEAEVLESLSAKLQGRKAELTKLDDQQNPPLLLEKAWGTFIASPRRPDTGAATLVIYEYQFNRFVSWLRKKHPGVKAMRDVTRVIAEEYATVLNSTKPSPNTYNKHLNVLTMVFRVLEEKAKLTSNPWEKIQRKRLCPQSRRELTIEELKKVCQGATGEFRLLFALGIYTGLRAGDCATLRWGEVDLDRNIIRRVPNKTKRRNPKPVIVPVHPVLRGMLKEAKAEGHGDYVLPKTANDYLYNRCELVRRIQEHFKASGITVHRPAAECAGLARQQPVVEVGFHSLRHTFVSLCRESNAPLAVVESIVGHSNPSMTRHYTHVGELAAGQAVAALPSLLGGNEALPPANGAAEVWQKVRAILESMTKENWAEKRAEAVALVPAPPAAAPVLATAVGAGA